MKNKKKIASLITLPSLGRGQGWGLLPSLSGGVGGGPLVWLSMLLLLTACGDHDEAVVSSAGPSIVTFSTEVSTSPTRTTTGLIKDLDALKASGDGFGVFAYLTDDHTFVETFPTSPASENPSKLPTTYSSFSDFFMFNQQVTWGISAIEGESVTRDWVYTPPKYWPNSTNNATPRRISFFAYAPWADASASPTSGVVNYTHDHDRTPHIIYNIGGADEQVDLLWANKTDATRNGQGLITSDSDPLTYQKVPLQFHHALAGVDIYVQRVYDEPAYGGKAPESEQNTKLYISKLHLSSTVLADDGKNGLQQSGKLSLIDGTWEDYDKDFSGGAADAWTTSEVTIDYGERMFVDSIRGTILTDEEEIRDAELDKWGLAKTGVTGKEMMLLRDSMTQVFIPRKVTLVPTLSYSMVTRDDNLQINYLTDTGNHRYARIPHVVTGNSVTLDLTAGKRYSLLLRIGVEHVSFEVLSIVDWDFPMRYTPSVVTDFESDEIGQILDEDDD